MSDCECCGDDEECCNCTGGTPCENCNQCLNHCKCYECSQCGTVGDEYQIKDCAQCGRALCEDCMTEHKHEKTLEEVVVGDEVTVCHHHDIKIETVERVTKTMITAGRSRYNRKTGYVVGGSGYWRSSIRPATDKDRTVYEKNQLVGFLANLRRDDLGKMTIGNLRQAATLLGKL